MDKEKLIQDYVAKRLSGEERISFEQLIAEDALLRAEVEEYQDLHHAFHLFEDKELKQHLQSLENESQEEIQAKVVPLEPRNNSKMWLRLAAACVLLFGLFYGINSLSPNHNKLYSAYFEPQQNTHLPILRGANQEELSYKAFNAYEKGDFEAAEQSFTALLQEENKLPVRFFYAMSLLNQNKLDVAAKELNVLKEQSFDYQSESLWYLALIQIKQKEFNQAKENLKELQRTNKDFKAKKVEELLSKIEK